MPEPRRPAPPACPRARHRGGFTLIECTMVCAVAAVLAGLAFPSYRQQQLRMARLDAVDALTRLQAAQERYRAATGLCLQINQPAQVRRTRSAAEIYLLSFVTAHSGSHRSKRRLGDGA